MKPGDLVQIKSTMFVGLVIEVRRATALILFDGSSKWYHKDWLVPVDETR